MKSSRKGQPQSLHSPDRTGPAPDVRPAAGAPPSAGSARRTVRRPHGSLPLPLVIAIDIFLVGAGLIVFSLFHHVLPRDVGRAGIQLPQSTVGGQLPADGPGTGTPTGASLPGGNDPLGPATDGSTSTAATGAASSATSPIASPSGSAQPTTATAAASANPAGGSFADRFRDKFTAGAVEKTATSYRSAHVSVTMKKVETGTVAYSIADIYVSDLKYLRTAFAGGKYGRGLTDTVIDMALRNKAITALSGDYYGIRDKGIVIRNGVLYRDVLFQDVCILNNDGSMQTFTAGAFDIATVTRRGAWQGWSFGPMLLKDGQPMTAFNSNVTVANPRGAIGYFEPGHYCFVLVDGRQPGYSEGMTMKQLSQLFYDLGCKAAYNLDGGQSATLTFADAIFNRPYQGGREISDIVCIVDA